MSGKRTPTFRIGDKLLVGREARKAWREQEVYCACGSSGDAAHCVDGTVGGSPAEWLGCDNCTGQALGRPLVYRLPNQIKAMK